MECGCLKTPSFNTCIRNGCFSVFSEGGWVLNVVVFSAVLGIIFGCVLYLKWWFFLEIVSPSVAFCIKRGCFHVHEERGPGPVPVQDTWPGLFFLHRIFLRKQCFFTSKYISSGQRDGAQQLPNTQSDRRA